MEYRGFHLQHHLQEEYARYCNPSTCQAWNSSNLYNSYSSTFTESSQSTIINLRDQGQEFGFDPQRTPSDDVLVASIKDEVSDNDLPRLSEMISSLSSSSVNDSLVSSIREHTHVTGKEIWPAGNYNLCHLQKRPIDGGIALSTKTYNFGAASSSSSNLSTLATPPSSLLSCSHLGLNSQMLLGGSSCGLLLSYDSFGLNEDSICLSRSIMQQRENSPSNSSNKISAFISGVARTKTTRNGSQPKEYEAKAKKSRTSCSTLKVRKEKLGDRIQTLQRLVAPFGKTNTASVLTEAMGYIHFLHDQIQTLSIPYMKSSKTKPFRMVQLDSKEEDNRESKPDLRSRGLCLVPLAYASCIHNFD